jgi:N-acetylneuraminic acid mutarotase
MYFMRLILFSALMLLQSTLPKAQNNDEKNMLAPVFQPQIAQFKGKFYIVSQSNNSFFQSQFNISNRNTDSLVILYEYIPKSAVIKKISESDFYSTFFSVCAVGNKIYVAGGYNTKGKPTKNLYEFDLTTKKWSEKSEMFFARTKFSLECINNKLYAFGGTDQKFSIEYYNPENDLWEILDYKQIPSNLKPLDTIAASGVIEDKVYLLGSNGKTFQIFTPSQSLISEGSATPIDATLFDLVVVNKKLYIGAGFNKNGIDNSIYLYDAVEGTWSVSGHIPIPRFGSGLAYFDKMIVFIGGSSDNNRNAIIQNNEIYLYRPIK